MSLLDVVAGCYQPAGPLIPGWDPQRMGQPVVQQVALSSQFSEVQPVTSQMAITSSSATNTCRPQSNKLCDGGTQMLATSRPAAESVLSKPHKMVSPGSVEVGVGTHSSDRKSGRSRSFHSSICSSEKRRNPAANVPVGAAHLVVADQERELDLSQKGSAYGSSISGAAVVTTHESIIKPAIGVVQEISHVTVTTCSSSLSQISHLERFVHGLVTSGGGSPATQAPEVMLPASSVVHTASCPRDSSTSPPKRKAEESDGTVEERQSISPKRCKYSVAGEECSSEIHESVTEKAQPNCGTAESPVTVMDSQPGDESAVTDASVKQDAVELVKYVDDSTASLPDVISTPLLSLEAEYIQQAVVEEQNQSANVVETDESCELVIDYMSSDEAASCLPSGSDKNQLHSPSEDTGGNPKNKDTASGNPKKGIFSGPAESKQSLSPLSKRRAQMSASVQEKRSEKLGTTQADKCGRRSADEGPTRSSSGRRKRDTGGWEWYGEPERKPVYFKVTLLCYEIFCFWC